MKRYQIDLNLLFPLQMFAEERSNTGGKPKNPSGGPPATVQPKPQLTRAERRAIQVFDFVF